MKNQSFNNLPLSASTSQKRHKQFAAERQPEPLEKQSETQTALKEFLAFRRQLVEERRRLTCQKEHAVLKTVNDQIAVLEEQIFGKIDGDDSLKEKFALLQSMPGIGRIVAATLLIDCPELAAAQPEGLCAGGTGADEQRQRQNAGTEED